MEQQIFTLANLQFTLVIVFILCSLIWWLWIIAGHYQLMQQDRLNPKETLQGILINLVFILMLNLFALTLLS